MKKNVKNIFLGGGAFGCVYHIGIVKALYKYKMDVNIYGNSAGALIGLFYVLNVPIKTFQTQLDEITIYTKKTISEKPLDFSSYQLTLCHFKLLKFINDNYPNAYKICSNRLNVGVTKTTGGFVWFNKFDSNEHLFNILLCSFNTPYLCNYDAKIDGIQCIDGGFGFNTQKHLPDNTIKVNLYDLPNYDLNANIPFLHRVLLPEPQQMQIYTNNGYNDMKHIIKKGFTQLGTESAQSASSLSLITAIASLEGGVLNVQRCKKDKVYIEKPKTLEQYLSHELVQTFICKLQRITENQMHTYDDLIRYLNS
jgi:hypothetical protein